MTEAKLLLVIVLLYLPSYILAHYNELQTTNPRREMVEIVELLLAQKPIQTTNKDNEQIIKIYPKQLTVINTKEPPEQEIRILYEQDDEQDVDDDMMTQETRYTGSRDAGVLPLSIEKTGASSQDVQNSKTQQKMESGNGNKRQVEYKQSTARPNTSTKQTSTTKSQPFLLDPEQVYKPIREPSGPKQKHYGLGETVVLTLSNQKQNEERNAEPLYVDQNKPYVQPSKQVGLAEYERKPVVNSNTRTSYDELYEQPQREVQRPYQEQPQREVQRPYQEQPQREVQRPYQEPPQRSYQEPPARDVRRPNLEQTPEPARRNPVQGHEHRETTRPTRDERTPENEEEDRSGYQGFPESYLTNPEYATPLQNNARSFPSSPCPHIFKYEGREPEVDKWYGSILVSTDQTLVGMRIEITLDKPAEMLANWVAEVRSKDNVHFSILSLRKTVIPGSPESVRILVRFNKNNPIPYVQSITLNGRIICQRPNLTPTNLQNSGNRPLNPNRRTTTEYYIEETTKRTQAPYYEQNNRRTTTEYYEPNGPDYYDNGRRTTTTQRTTPIYRPDGGTDYYEEERPRPNKVTSRPVETRPVSQSSKPTNDNTRPLSNTQTNKPTIKPNQNDNSGSSTSSGSKVTSTSSRPNYKVPVGKKPRDCGKASVQPRPLITHGQMTARGQWPWHVALYKNEGINLNYICGGSLISDNIVLTAAHCVTYRLSTRPVEANVLVVYLGKYHLKLWSEGGVKDKQVAQLHVHPDYNSTSFSSDLAILVLSSAAEFSDFIKPVCLWDRRKVDISHVLGKEGTVIGWGYDENQRLTEDLMQAAMPVVSQESCLRSFPKFFPYFTSNLTYCAGFKNGTSVCNGDSGGGMVFPQTVNNEERWNLRGLVSISVSEKDLRVCDTRHYVVFTDIAKYLDWIDTFF